MLGFEANIIGFKFFLLNLNRVGVLSGFYLFLSGSAMSNPTCKLN